MHRCLRRDVVEGERILILGDLPARDLAPQDAREDIPVVVRAEPADRHDLSPMALQLHVPPERVLSYEVLS